MRTQYFNSYFENQTETVNNQLSGTLNEKTNIKLERFSLCEPLIFLFMCQDENKLPSLWSSWNHQVNLVLKLLLYRE